MIHPPSVGVRKHIRVWLAALVGWPALHVPILLRSTPFCRHTAASQLLVTCVRPFMHFTTFTLLMTTGSPSHPQSPHPSIHTSIFRIHRMLRLILTLFPHLEQNVLLSRRIAMLIGDLRSAPLFVRGPSFLSSNSGVCARHRLSTRWAIIMDGYSTGSDCSQLG